MVVRRFAFDEDFEEGLGGTAARRDAPPPPPPPPEPPPEPPAPTFSEAELEAARAEAHAQGKAEGRAEAKKAIDFQIAQALGRIVAAAEEAVAEQAEQRAGLTADAARLAFAIVGKVLPALMRGHGAAEVEALIAGCLDERPEEARLTVRLHPEMHDALKPRIAEMAAERGFEGKLVLLRDAALDFGDCRVEWADGGIERLVARVWADLDAATARALGAEPGLVAAMMAEPEPPAAADAPMETAAETAA